MYQPNHLDCQYISLAEIYKYCDTNMLCHVYLWKCANWCLSCINKCEFEIFLLLICHIMHFWKQDCELKVNTRILYTVFVLFFFENVNEISNIKNKGFDLHILMWIKITVWIYTQTKRFSIWQTPILLQPNLYK